MTITTAAPVAARTRTALTVGAILLVLGCLVISYFDFFVPTGVEFDGPAEYIYTLNGIPFMGGLVVLLFALRGIQNGRDGRLGVTGATVATVGVAAILVALIFSVVTGREDSFGPAYPLGTLASFIGLIFFTIAALRARVLPWWTTPALTVTWIVGGPVGDGGPLGFRASALLLAAVTIAIAAVAPRSLDKA